MVARRASGARVRAIPHTACATIATATMVSPCTTPAAIGPDSTAAPAASATMITTEGSVKAAKAASAPPTPARIRPRANPTWLEVGPGRN